MPIKCVVVHLADDPRHRARLDVAVEIAQRFGAHLNVVYATEPVDYPAGAIGRAVSLEYLDEQTERANVRAAEIQREVEEVCNAHLASWKWHVGQGDVDEIVSRYAHLADLIIAEQISDEFPIDRTALHMSDQLIIAAGCAMLIVPHVWTSGTIGNRVLIAWKNNRETIGAVRGALDFLCEAAEVFILPADDAEQDTPGEDLARYLSRHGISAQVLGVSANDGDDILDVAVDKDCDLIVMGAYAHSRLREIIFGGATQHVMRHTTIPVLMRH
jgi:nucleotide-binding universal stress UspA family protein